MKECDILNLSKIKLLEDGITFAIFPKEYIYPTIEGEMGWCSASSASSDSDDALENWKNRMHEVSLKKCGLITQSLCHVETQIIEFLTYEGLSKLYRFLEEF